MSELLDSIIEDIESHKPEPSPFAYQDSEAVSESVNDRVSEPEKSSVGGGLGVGSERSSFLRDDKGGLFDPDIHATNDTGEPIYNKDGSFRKKRGRKKGSSTTANVDTSRAVAEQQARQAGQATAHTIFTICRAVGGDEWTPIVDHDKGIDEPATMTDAWAQYFLATGKTDLPPWLGLSIVMTAYAAPRVMMPKTQGRLSVLWEAAKSRWDSWRNNGAK